MKFLLPHNKLPQMSWLRARHIYDSKASVGPVSDHGLAGASAGVSPGCTQGVAGIGVSSEAQGPLASTCGSWQNSFFLTAVEPLAASLFKVSRKGSL